MASVPGPRTYPERVPAWYLHSTEGVVLAGPFAAEAAARVARVRFAARLGDAMRRDGGPSSAADVEACVAKLRIGFGIRPEPHGRFKAVPQEAPPAD
jgi:hypothetical protein